MSDSIDVRTLPGHCPKCGGFTHQVIDGQRHYQECTHGCGEVPKRDDDDEAAEQRQRERLTAIVDETAPLTEGVVHKDPFQVLRAAKTIKRIAESMEKCAEMKINRAAAAKV